MTINEVAKRLEVSPVTVNNWVTGGKLQGVKEDGRWAISEEQLVAFQLTRKKAKKYKVRGTATAAAGALAGAIEKLKKPRVTTNGHSREPQIRQVIDSWLDGLAESKRVVGIGELTRNDVQDLARRIWRVV